MEAAAIEHQQEGLPEVAVFFLKGFHQLGQERCEHGLIGCALVHRHVDSASRVKTTDQINVFAHFFCLHRILLVLWSPFAASLVQVRKPALIHD